MNADELAVKRDRQRTGKDHARASSASLAVHVKFLDVL